MKISPTRPEPFHPIEKIQAIFPNAEELWQGYPNPNTAVVEWNDGHFVMTHERTADDREVYTLGLYPGDSWEESGEAAGYYDIDTPEHVVELLDWLTDNQPEGTDFWAWVVQWMSDNHPEHVTGAV